MASSRERRVTAGNKLSRLLNEEEDEFYKTTYGGFEEIEDDVDYQSEVEVEDEVDSDFSIDEDDEVLSDLDEKAVQFEEKSQRKVPSNAYKDPKVCKRATIQCPKREYKRQKHLSTPIDLPNKESDNQTVVNILGRKSIRHSTALKSAETLKRMKERSAMKRRLRRDRDKNRNMTQEQRLEEAKITEIENLKSLEQFQRLELEKKLLHNVKKTYKGSTTKFVSTTIHMDSKIYQDLDIPEINRKGAINYLEFSDNSAYRKEFPNRVKRTPRPQKICALTGLPARYVDPVTEVPYYNLNVFKTIREAYYLFLEEKGNRSDPQVVDWLDWRHKQKNAGVARYSASSVLSALKQLPNFSQTQPNPSRSENLS